MSRNIVISVTLDEHELAQLSSREAFEVITGMDLARHDWGFTLKLADHFDKLRAEHAKEEAEDAVAPADGTAKCPVCTRVDGVPVSKGERLLFCAQCALGEHRKVRLVFVAPSVSP